jgi:hypothetical protein
MSLTMNESLSDIEATAFHEAGHAVIALASPDISVRPNGAVHQWRKDSPRKLSVGPGSRRAACLGDRAGRSLVTKAATWRPSDPAGRNVSKA